MDRLPLKELELLVLLSLEEGPLHGYALLGRVGERSGGFVKPGPASLYRVLAILADEGLIEETDGPESSEGPPRRTLRLTGRGRAVLTAELERLQALLGSARALGIDFGGTGGGR